MNEVTSLDEAAVRSYTDGKNVKYALKLFGESEEGLIATLHDFLIAIAPKIAAKNDNLTLATSKALLHAADLLGDRLDGDE